MNPKTYFLPYQWEWIKDDSPIKISEKSRRIGMTYAQSYEDVRDCSTKKVPAVWFSSADETAAREYILYCEKWARAYDIAAKSLGTIVIDRDQDIKAFSIEFANGTRINALSSNPTQFRSKGGKVVLDEYAFHKDPEAMWKAAYPAATWGYPIRILSTYNGKGNRYYRFIESIKKGDLNWSLHTTTIYDAVAQGLYDKIMGRKTSPEERAAWIQSLRDSCFDEDTFQQEFNCIPIDEATAFLPYDLIRSCEDKSVLVPLENVQGDLYVGVDIGRKKDLTVIWVIEKIGRIAFTRSVIEMERRPFREQREELFSVLRHPKLRRACIDATGLGMQLAEEAQEEFGKYRVEAITITARVKEEIAFGLKRSMEDRSFIVPEDKKIREDFHSVRKVTTSSGNIRFDADRSATDGHADRFIAAALSDHASQDGSGEINIASRSRRTSSRLLDGY